MTDASERRVFKVYFIKEHRWFFNKKNQKKRSDYILNIDKIIKEKFEDEPFYVLNTTQAFLLNYEIGKLLDKAINIRNQKYDKIVCINANLTSTSVLNIMKFLSNKYGYIDFEFMLFDKDDQFDELEIKKEAEGLLVLKDDIID